MTTWGLGGLAERMLAAMLAGEAKGGDSRGKQPALAPKGPGR